MLPVVPPSSRGASSINAGSLWRWVILSGVIGTAAILGALIGLSPTIAIFPISLILATVFLILSINFAKRKSRGDGYLAILLMLWWVLAIGMPAMVAFDNTGLTKSAGLFNLQSMSRIFTFGLAGLVVLISVFYRSGIVTFKYGLSFGRYYWAVFVYAGIVSIFGVAERDDLILSEYRVLEWLIFGLLSALLLNRLEYCKQGSSKDLISMMAPAILFPAAVNWIVLPLLPSMVFQGNRLGGVFTHPNLLGVVSAMAFFLVAEKSEKYRSILMIAALVTLLATFSRGSYVGFLLATVIWVGLRIGNLSYRVLFFIAITFVGFSAYVGKDAYLNDVMQLLSRGHKVENLTSLSERTVVWDATKILIDQKPITGHGFVSGAKKIGEVMATMPIGRYFRAPHAHNEFLQAIVSVGWGFAIALGLFYLRYAFLLAWFFRLREDIAMARVFIAWFALILVHGFLGPVLTNPIYLQGALFVMPYLWLEKRRAAFVAMARAK